MDDHQNTPVRRCSRGPHGGCTTYAPGHQLHVLHAREVGREPWGWRDAVVTDLDAPWVGLQDVASAAGLRLWHHAPLTDLLALGDPVRVHEELHVLGAPLGWVNVVVRDGLGPVPRPRDLSAWKGRGTGAVVDLATGRGVAMDWLDRDG